MVLGIISDHRGYDLKERIKKELEKKGFQINDYGAYSKEASDHPDFAFRLGEAINNKEVDFGIAICGTGIGMCIACNKVKGIKCAKVDTIEEAAITRKDNDSNIIAFGAKKTLPKAIKMIENFVNTPCSTEERFIRRRNKIKKYEESK